MDESRELKERASNFVIALRSRNLRFVEPGCLYDDMLTDISSVLTVDQAARDISDLCILILREEFVLADFDDGDVIPHLLLAFCSEKQLFLDKVAACRERDADRGRKIIPGYNEVNNLIVRDECGEPVMKSLADVDDLIVQARSKFALEIKRAEFFMSALVN